MTRLGAPLGRLCLLKEAAGKVRVIAIVDAITNWALKPIHEWVFSILKYLPQDGTFDQDSPLLRLREESMKSDDKYIGCCDMSAATDRLPVKLQSYLLAHVLGHEIAEAWMKLLVLRPYQHNFKNYTYAVGQPMGALSS